MFKFRAHYFMVWFFSLLLTPVIQAESLKDIQKTAKKSTTIETASQAMTLHSEELRQFMLTLYQANPQELKRSTQVSAEEMVQWTFEGPFGWKFDGVRHLQELDALSLAVDADFTGDRVLALITGLHTSLTKAYGGKNEYDFSGDINPQCLYNAARHIETTNIKIAELNQMLDKSGKPLVLLGNEKSIDLTEQLSALIHRVDADANGLVEQIQQRFGC